MPPTTCCGRRPLISELHVFHEPRDGVSIEGAADALLWLPDRLRAPAGPVRLAPAAGPDRGRALTEVRIERQAGPVRITVEAGSLVLRGGPEQLGVLAGNLAWFARNGDPSDPLAHMHEEHYEIPG